MKLFLFLLLLPTALFAQNVWVDYIIGRPIPGYTSSREAVAAEWGINYKPILAGDVVSDDMYVTAENHKKNNAAYLAKLDKEYGSDWKRYFQLESAIKRLQANNSIEGKWVEVFSDSSPNANKQYLSAKQQLAEKWGIPYEGIIVSAGNPPSEEQEKLMLANTHYTRHLDATLGEDWQNYFNRQLQIKLQQKTARLNTWNEYLLEEVDEAYYEAKKEVLATWGINYQPYFVHCCRKKEKKMAAGDYAAKAELAKAKITALYGKGWMDHLKVEIQKKLKK